MDDDSWGEERDKDDRRRWDDEFGEPLFDDDPPTGSKTEGALLAFGESGADLPHRTEPATGRVPGVRGRDAPHAFGDDDADDLDVWSSFSSHEPTWRDDASTEDAGPEAAANVGSTEPGGEGTYEARLGPGETGRREPTRISIGSGLDEPTGREMLRPYGGRPPRGTRLEGTRRPRPEGAARRPPPRRASERDMPAAVVVGLGIAAIFCAALLWKPIAVLAIVVLVCGLGAVELFDRLTDKGYQPASAVGIVACLAAPLAAYWVGDGGLPLVLAFAFLASAITFVGAKGLESAPLTNLAVTICGVTWIGLLGSYAALIVDLSNVPMLEHVGTDTLFILAAGVVANDVGALVTGSAAGRTPLREWISPNKSVEGLIGGTVATLLAVWLVSLQSDTWNDLHEALLLGIVIAVLAPLGDLVESMLKRDLQVKDFGTVVRGHGGVLDRFDGFLFVLPGVYYLLLTLEPFAS